MFKNKMLGLCFRKPWTLPGLSDALSPIPYLKSSGFTILGIVFVGDSSSISRFTDPLHHSDKERNHVL